MFSVTAAVAIAGGGVGPEGGIVAVGVPAIPAIEAGVSRAALVGVAAAGTVFCGGASVTVVGAALVPAEELPASADA
ncbi:MAG: hypothetical protein LC118_00970, partial [Dehalococcoidia bacterium]|nr:hypothetical protein [Dehalococcoidia bacterium]